LGDDAVGVQGNPAMYERIIIVALQRFPNDKGRLRMPSGMVSEGNNLPMASPAASVIREGDWQVLAGTRNDGSAISGCLRRQ
jgi:hypothetical protein